MPLTDLAVDTFLILKETFFNEDGSSKSFSLRDKKNTQSDPLDEYISKVLSDKLIDSRCQKSPGPLINPDLVIYRPDKCEQVARTTLKEETTSIVAIEVKKLLRAKSGQVARSTGIDYNTTPPCGTVRVYDASEKPLDIQAFYLFVCQEEAEEGKILISALALCDGNVLNADFSLYLQITGQRTKGVGLGTYGDGANRNRPMLIFANPLGAAQLDHSATLVTRNELPNIESRVGLVYQIGRTIPEGGQGIFYAYRKIDDIPQEWEIQHLVDPFPKPVNRVETTQARGKFKLPIKYADDLNANSLEN